MEKKGRIFVFGACLLFVILQGSGGIIEFFQDLGDAFVDAGYCLGSQLLMWRFWLFLLATLTLKQYMLLPHMEQYYKRTHAARAQVRKRRLRDTLNDPVLALQMEERLLRRRDIQGDRTKMLEAMEQIREMAHDDNNNGNADAAGGPNENNNHYHSGKGDDAATKGQEKFEASNAMLWGTIFVSILLFGLFNTGTFVEFAEPSPYAVQLPHTTVLPQELHRARMRAKMEHIAHRAGQGLEHRPGRRLLSATSFYDDAAYYCGAWQPLLSLVLFCLIHLLHSYKLVLDATRKARPRQSSPPPKDMEVDEQARSDLEQPLLPAGEEKTIAKTEEKA